MTTIVGILCAIGALIISALLEETKLSSLINLPAAVLILGGTIGATFASYSMKELKHAFSSLKLAFLDKDDYKIESIVSLFTELSEIARKEGLLALENRTQDLKHPMFMQGIQMVTDGTEPSLLKSMFEAQASLNEERLKVQSSIFQTAGGFAPTMGIIGTVVGLVKVLGNLGESSDLGPAIATAFIATLYGISFANIICIPIAKKIKAKAMHTTLITDLILEGLLSLVHGDNPRIVHEKLLMFVEENKAKNAGAGKSTSNAA